jgi:hypothetical protein
VNQKVGYEEAPRYHQTIEALTGDREIVPPGLILESDRHEWKYQKREHLFLCADFQAALAANFNELVITLNAPDVANPKLAVILAIYTDQISRVALQAVTGAAAGNFGVALDSRGPLNNPMQIFKKQVAAQVLTTANSWVALPVGLTVLPLPFVLFKPVSQSGGASPSPTAVMVESSVVNVAQNVCFFGYVRGARPEEGP